MKNSASLIIVEKPSSRCNLQYMWFNCLKNNMKSLPNYHNIIKSDLNSRTSIFLSFGQLSRKDVCSKICRENPPSYRSLAVQMFLSNFPSSYHGKDEKSFRHSKNKEMPLISHKFYNIFVNAPHQHLKREKVGKIMWIILRGEWIEHLYNCWDNTHYCSREALTKKVF